MGNRIDKIKTFITPATSTPQDTLKALQAKTRDLESQAKYAETEARLHERAEKAKKRIKAARKRNIRPLYIIGGLVLLAIIILVVSGSC